MNNGYERRVGIEYVEAVERGFGVDSLTLLYE